jgi:hypothetical protein
MTFSCPIAERRHATWKIRSRASGLWRDLSWVLVLDADLDCNHGENA